MAITSGFWTSRNGDRKYTAEQLSSYLDGIVGNGVFANVGSALQVAAVSGMRISVQSGKGFIDGFWMLNSNAYAITVSASEIAQSRIDSVFMTYRVSNRTIGIEYMKGTPAASPSAPAIIRNDTVKSYRLANILVGAGVTTISQANITDTRPSSDCGWVTSVIDQVDTSQLFNQWESAYSQFYNTSTKEFDEWASESKKEFDDWFKYLKDVLASATLIRTYESYYVTKIQDETEIPINIQKYDKNLDILQVYVSGLKLAPLLDYIQVDSSKITLTKPVDVGTVISFTVYKSVDGTDATSVLSLVENLQTDVDELQADMTNLENSIKDLKPIESTVTLSSSNWTGDFVPYIYDLKIENKYDFMVMLSNDVTVEEIKIISAAQIMGNANDNLLRAWGNKPTTNISIILRKWVK